MLTFLYDPVVAHCIPGHIESTKQANKKIKKFINFVTLYLLMVVVGVVFGIVSCLPLFSYEKKLPFFISFPFNFNYSEIVYWIAYTFIALGGVCCVASNLITVIIWYIMLNYSVEYEVLENKLRNLGVNKTNKTTNVKLTKNSRKSLQNSFQKDLVTLIKDHRYTYEYGFLTSESFQSINIFSFYHRQIEQFRSCFSQLFLIQITTGGIFICVSTCNLAFVSNTKTEIYFYLLIIFIRSRILKKTGFKQQY